MIVGVPKETKRDEYRVGLLPVGVEELTRAGHHVMVEAGAGLGSGLADHDYLKHGAEMVAGPEELYARAHMIVKVKEPQPAELPLLGKGQIIFAYFHFAADRQLTEDLLDSGCIAVAYETLGDGHRPGRLRGHQPALRIAKGGEVTNRAVAETFEMPYNRRFEPC